MEADISKGDLDLDRRRGDRQEGRLDNTTIKGVLNISLASDVLGIVMARAYTSSFIRECHST